MSSAELPFEILEEPAREAVRVTVFRPTLPDGTRPGRSLALHAPPELVRVPDARVPPRFSIADGAVRAHVAFGAGTSFYGTGEVAGALERTGTRITLWNTDAMPYDETSTLYQSHPYVLAVLPDGRAQGWLADSIRRGTIAIDAAGVELAFEEEPFDLYCIEAAHPMDVTRALARLVGRMALPPLWALGYHQCRWSYLDADELRTLAAEFRRRGIPCDALWLDIDYMERFRVFTVDARAFPDLGGLTDELRALGFRSVAILDPGVAVDSELAEEGRERDLFVHSPEGEPAVGKVWPGECHFPDFTDARTRAWWAEHVRAFVERSRLDGLWNDMNEPSVFDVPGRSLAPDCRHAGLDAERGARDTHARWHNLYGQLMVESSRAGFEAARPGRRPFLLTRAGHLGTARLAATWTGDNRARWEDLRWSIAMALNLGLSGQPFAGPDAGGFSDNPSGELFARWFELAALLPFFRGHAEKSSRRKEPWAIDAATEVHVRAAIERRMKLLPTLYTLFHEAAESGAPVVRPLFFAAPRDAELRTVDDAFLLGDALLVAPVVHERAHERRVLLPRVPGGWYPFPGGPAPILEREHTAAAPLGTVPLFARAGSIVFENEPRASTAVPARLLVVHVFLDEEGRAEGRLYEDEGEGHAHREGVYRDAVFTVRASDDEVAIDERARGTFDSAVRERFFVVHAGGKTILGPRTRADAYRLRR